MRLNLDNIKVKAAPFSLDPRTCVYTITAGGLFSQTLRRQERCRKVANARPCRKARSRVSEINKRYAREKCRPFRRGGREGAILDGRGRFIARERAAAAVPLEVQVRAIIMGAGEKKLLFVTNGYYLRARMICGARLRGYASFFGSIRSLFCMGEVDVIVRNQSRISRV